MIRKNRENNGFKRVKYLDHRVDEDHGDERRPGHVYDL